MGEFRILSNDRVATGTYELRLEGPVAGLTTPGQFVTIEIPGFYLRRPFSVADWSEQTLRLFYKVVGDGTEALSTMQEGKLSVMTGLGNGFDVHAAETKKPVLIGGGVGIPPLFGLAKRLVNMDKTPLVLLGFNRADELFLVEGFEEIGADVRVATVDGSVGTEGFVTTLFEQAIDAIGPDAAYVYTCGPMPMFQTLAKEMNRLGMDGCFSLEERMGCAVGICMGCSIETTEGMRRVCKEGPVFSKEVLPWA